MLRLWIFYITLLVTAARIDNRIIGFILKLILKIMVIAQLPHGLWECAPFILLTLWQRQEGVQNRW